MFSVCKNGVFVFYNGTKINAKKYINKNGGQLYRKDLEKQKIHKAGWWFKED